MGIEILGASRLFERPDSPAVDLQDVLRLFSCQPDLGAIWMVTHGVRLLVKYVGSGWRPIGMSHC